MRALEAGLDVLLMTSGPGGRAQSHPGGRAHRTPERQTDRGKRGTILAAKVLTGLDRKRFVDVEAIVNGSWVYIDEWKFDRVRVNGR